MKDILLKCAILGVIFMVLMTIMSVLAPYTVSAVWPTTIGFVAGNLVAEAARHWLNKRKVDEPPKVP